MNDGVDLQGKGYRGALQLLCKSVLGAEELLEVFKCTNEVHETHDGTEMIHPQTLSHLPSFSTDSFPLLAVSAQVTQRDNFVLS